MFSLYKCILAQNIRASILTPVVSKEMKLRCSYELRGCRLFELPLLPDIEVPEKGLDIRLSPYKNIYIEGIPLSQNSEIYMEYENQLFKPVFGVTITQMFRKDYVNEILYMKEKCVENGRPSFYTEGEYQNVLSITEERIKAQVPLEAKWVTETRFFSTVPVGGAIILFRYVWMMNENMENVLEEITDEDCNIIDCEEPRENDTPYYKLQWDLFHSFRILSIRWLNRFLRFVNISNIRSDKVELDKKTKKHIHRHTRRNETHYHILKVLKPSRTKTGESTHKDKGESLMPLHQVRGHLADYTKGKGLFGKYNIRVWIPEHWRGDLKYGQVKKDYQLVRK